MFSSFYMIFLDPHEFDSSYSVGQQGNPFAINFNTNNNLLTREKTNGVSTIFMESYVLVQQAYYTSTPAALKENESK